MVEVFGAQINGPIRIGMTLLTTNEIAELVVFYGLSLSDHDLSMVPCVTSPMEIYPPVGIPGSDYK